LKSQFRIALLFSVLLIIILMISGGCSSDANDILIVDNEGNTNIDKAALENTINQNSAQELIEIEEEGILFMREEEKLARDVYIQLYQLWGTNTFDNIGSSEQTHMDAMKSLIERYDLTDPANGMAVGEFSNSILQQLHNELIEDGGESEIDALKVGAAIEEIDIIDIEKYINQTSKQDIITVYENLLKGSRNHLRSFVSVMEKRGLTYEPQYLTEEQFDDIVTKTIER